MSLLLAFIAKSITSGTPILFGTLGEIITEKVGHLNLGVEGMMSIGACAGFMVGYKTDNLFLAILAAFGAGVLAALVYAILTVTFMANQNVTGLTLTIFGVGFANFIGFYAREMAQKEGVSSLKLPEKITAAMADINIPGLSDIPFIGPLLFNYNPFVYLAIIIAIVLSFYLKKTKTGLSIRAIGENPAAADAAGIPVTLLKYLNVCLGGGICGIGGAFMIMIVNNGVWISDCVGGIGWISVALVIFATWNPTKAIFGSFVFGALRQLKHYVPDSIGIPTSIYDMLPYVITIIVLVVSSVKSVREKSQPEACGLSYFREER